MIQIVPYSEAWPLAFKEEAAALRRALGSSAVRIAHVGSTSVPGLAAKPVIDIQVAVVSLAPLSLHIQPLATLGYVHVPLGDFDRVYPFFHKPPTWPSSHHVHLCSAGGEQELRHLAFRDYLRDNATARQQYETLKRHLATEHHGLDLESRERYSLAKTEFIEGILSRALNSGYPRALEIG